MDAASYLFTPCCACVRRVNYVCVGGGGGGGGGGGEEQHAPAGLVQW